MSGSFLLNLSGSLSDGFLLKLTAAFCGLVMFIMAANAAADGDFFQKKARAIETWEAELLQPELAGKQRIDTLLRLAGAYQALGKRTPAYKTLQKALSLADSAGMPNRQMRVHNRIADVLLTMQESSAAKTHIDKGLEIARTRKGKPPFMAHLQNTLGNVLNVREKYPKALDAYAKAAELAGGHGNRVLQIQALINQASVYLKQDNTRAQVIKLTKTLSRLRAYAKLPALQLLALGRLALRIQSRFPETRLDPHQIFTEALQLGEQRQDKRLTAFAKGYLGQVYEEARRYPEALQLTREAIFLSQDTPDLLYRWAWQQGRILQAQRNLGGAADAYRRALLHLQKIRTGLMMGERDSLEVFRDRIRPVYYALADVLLQQATAADSPEIKTRLLKQARDAVEFLKAAELQNYFQDACVAAAKARAVDDLDARTAVLYPILLPDRTELLLTLPDGIHREIVTVGADTVGQTALAFQHNLQIRTRWRFIKQARLLHKWLIAPFRDKLTARGIDTLVIVPDGPLRMIPLAALHDGKKYLISDLALAVTPGLDLTDPRHLPRQDIGILLNGLSDSVQRFSALPNVPEEISRIGALYANSEVLLNQKFSLKGVHRALAKNPYAIVHVASHGQFDRNPERTFLLTYDDKLTMDRLENLLELSQLRNEPVELLTLSACQTAAGDERAALGLAGVAIKAGARSALASLWFVNDEAASRLVVEFYRQLQNPDLSKAQALQNAQKKLIKQKAFRHPAYWSPFLLIGNWL
ncbi:MAG: CHAT domain-containing protein [Gammaproteobacteria bacterium]|nr:CHAT domain-containing protein [Gammaproteobacteria bacterium]